MHFLVFPIVATLLLWVIHGWATSSIPWLGRRKRMLAIALGVLLVSEVIARRIELAYHVGGTMQTVGVVIVMTLVVAAAPIAAMRLASAVLARLRRGPHEVVSVPVAEPASASPAPLEPVTPMSRRQMVEASGGLALLGVTGSMMGWGIVRGRTAFELNEIPVHIPGLPARSTGTSSCR